MWVFDRNMMYWTWVSGASTSFTKSEYGTKGVPDATNAIGWKEDSSSWVDDEGNVWIYGGQGCDVTTYENMNGVLLYSCK